MTDEDSDLLSFNFNQLRLRSSSYAGVSIPTYSPQIQDFPTESPSQHNLYNPQPIPSYTPPPQNTNPVNPQPIPSYSPGPQYSNPINPQPIPSYSFDSQYSNPLNPQPTPSYSPPQQYYQSIQSPRPIPQQTFFTPQVLNGTMEAQLILIQTIFPHLDGKKISQSTHTNKIESQIDNLLIKLSNYPQYISTLKDLKSKFRCELCQKNKQELSFRCGHSVCGNCFTRVIGSKIVPPLANEPPIKCPRCQFDLDHSDYSYYFPDWEERLKASDSESRKSSRALIKCKSCKRDLKFTCFAGCKCVCFECQLNRRMLGMCDCGQRFSYNISCDGCHKRIESPYMHPFVLLCSGHLYCEACMNQLIGDFTCTVCREQLNDSDIRKLTRRCLKQCRFCKKNYGSLYFLSIGCCGDNVCILCQYEKNKVACVGCRRKFEFGVDDYMGNFRLFN